MGRWITLLSLLVCLMVPACVKDDLDDRFRQGLDLIYENRYADAEGLFLAISREMGRSKRPDAFAYKARALFQAGRVQHLYLKRPKHAVRRLREAIKIHPQADFAFQARLEIADIFLDQLRDYRAAALEFERLVHDYPDRSDADRYQYRVAQCYFLLKDYEQARTEARILLNRWPNGEFHHQAGLLLANAYYLEGKLDEAAKAHERLLAANPDDSVRARSQFELGMCHQELGETARAERAFLAALKFHPRPDLVQMQLSALRKQIAQAEESATPLPSPTAGKVYRHTVQGSPSPAPKKPKTATSPATSPGKSQPAQKAKAKDSAEAKENKAQAKGRKPAPAPKEPPASKASKAPKVEGESAPAP